MYVKRVYPEPKSSFFLFGPRGVGKSTWISKSVPFDLEIDLLERRLFLELQRNPSELEARVGHLKKGALVFIDEIQKLPELLDEVHRLMEKRQLKFALSGSSARKLRKAGVNLLGGRAKTRHFYPFSWSELKTSFDLEQALMYGTMPIAWNEPDKEEREETLVSYVETYLQQEIKEEALVRRIEEFSRFLEVAGQLNGHILNFENVSREAEKSASTIQNWYQILIDSLLGAKIPPFRPGFRVRESASNKYYWFDTGVARNAAGLSPKDVDSLWLGRSLETVILNELLVYKEVTRKRNAISYYQIPGGGEIDFIIETQKKTLQKPSKFISIECKNSTKWKRDYEKPSLSLKSVAKENLTAMYGIYRGKERLTHGNFEVLPFELFAQKLHQGELF